MGKYTGASGISESLKKMHEHNLQKEEIPTPPPANTISVSGSTAPSITSIAVNGSSPSLSAAVISNGASSAATDTLLQKIDTLETLVSTVYNLVGMMVAENKTTSTMIAEMYSAFKKDKSSPSRDEELDQFSTFMALPEDQQRLVKQFVDKNGLGQDSLDQLAHANQSGVSLDTIERITKGGSGELPSSNASQIEKPSLTSADIPPVDKVFEGADPDFMKAAIEAELLMKSMLDKMNNNQ